jgi:hypothetical protein
MKKIINSRPWIQFIDDEREIGNSIIVTLAKGWYFTNEKDCGVQGFDNISELKNGTNKKSVYQK